MEAGNVDVVESRENSSHPISVITPFYNAKDYVDTYFQKLSK